MKKLIDFDGMFDRKLAEYMEENEGKYTEKQWENIIPKLYRNFGDTVVKSIGMTPRQYYAAMGDGELTETLVRHVREGVPVPDFLCLELEKRGYSEATERLLSEKDVQLRTLAVGALGADPRAFGAYFGLLRDPDTDEDVLETVCEQLKAGADEAKEQALACYREGVRTELMLEILSRCRSRDERVFDILMKEFRTAEELLPMRASYLAAYGDERALPALYEVIDRDETNYLEYQELKYAIEALGGEYTRVRDFSEDPYFLEIAAQSQPPAPDDGKKS